ncbi:MAG: anchor protein [Rariglobus sp.]|jgi:hypothetical protein|nr:anchor protein [Rariglobus sp.]
MNAYLSPRHLLRALVALAASIPLAPLAVAVTYTWDGNGDSNASGNWFTTANWSPDGAPAFGGDIATFGDVTTGTRTVTISGGSTTGVSFVSFTQSTAGAVNLLSVQKTFSISNGFNLSATAGTEAISVGTGSSGITLTANNASTVGTNGILELQNTSAITGTGSLTLSGGTLNVAAFTGSSSIQSTVGLEFIMSSGAIVIDNTGTGIVSDRRLAFSGNVNITGGSISSTRNGTAGGIFLNGATNVISPASFDSDLTLYIAANGDQSLTTNQAFAGAGITLRGYGTKTITSTGGGAINTISFIDANSSSSIGTTLKLGSDLTLASGAAQPIASNFGNADASIQFGIDTAGYTFDLSAGASSGAWTPNNSTQQTPIVVTDTTWTLSNSGTAGAGGIKATAFNFSAVGVTVNVGSGLVLTATGGNGTASNLGSAGTFSSSASFVYAGAAAAGTPATLASGRTIGSLVVESGALKITGSAFTAAGGITVNDGALLDFSTQTVAAPSIILEIAGAAFGQIKTGASSYDFAALTFNITSTPVSGVMDLFDLGAGGSGATPASVALSGLYGAVALTESAGVWTGEAGGLLFSFAQLTGDLTVSAIPEPSTYAMLAGLLALGLVAWTRRSR